ncbi:polyphosphate polymerase domain-containing protein [Adlercreutzia shanghongiae]|uniref:Polyphosphate polymerase domain-containing protein n=1 Tax=Adlercreutzia shanghongiae TaxID=3111773 RepID=A0ABU6J1F9_9ACTN|nr:polyphosphate polymerase domain-containing protein [Adlercreutzia sp. R22]MEC4295935.1 polyphosphate polymerase domain-containing protein [Adlercreutzia sp. R22]
MASYNSVFKRVEKKYRIGVAERAVVEAAASGLMKVDAYGRTRITSLYLDTPERAMIARSVEKPLYKEKLRLRAYGEADGAALMAAFAAGPLVRECDGVPLSDAEVERRVRVGLGAAAYDGGLCATMVFFGIKKKFKGIVYKRRLALTLPAALAFVSGLPYEQACARWPLADETAARVALSAATRQIARELEAAMDRNLPLVPSMGIACDREAWGFRSAALAEHADDALFDAELRITFDDCLEYLDCRRLGGAPRCGGTGSGSGSGWLPIIEPAESIMEIKSAGPYPAWLVASLSAHAIYPASFTKYGNAYQLCSRAQEKFAAVFCKKGGFVRHPSFDLRRKREKRPGHALAKPL